MDEKGTGDRNQSRVLLTSDGSKIKDREEEPTVATKGGGRGVRKALKARMVESNQEEKRPARYYEASRAERSNKAKAKRKRERGLIKERPRNERWLTRVFRIGHGQQEGYISVN